jgi:hypothetical protein
MDESHFSRGPLVRPRGMNIMTNMRRIARLGILAMGLGVGAAVASTPGMASADSLDFQISVDGYDLFPTTGNLATATTEAGSLGNIAIAFGDGATASTGDGTGQFSFADGSDALAATGGNNDTAIDIGNNNGTGEFALAGTGNNDFSFVDADNSSAYSGGDLLDPNLPGNNDVAIVFDPFGAGGDNVVSGIDNLDTGNFDFGAVLFQDGATSTAASGANYLYDVVTALGEETNHAAASTASWWAELLALF